MGILANQAFRLLREEWTSPLELAQELYAIFRSKEPVQIDSPVQLTNPTSEPALSIANNGNGTDVGPVFNITSGEPGAITFNNLFPGVTPPGPATAVSTGGGGGIPARVVSGSGATYSVQLYPDGVTAGSIVTATQLQIAAGETIPANSSVIVTKAGGRYFMQLPVWL